MTGRFLKQSTASQTRTIGPFVDDTDFKTLEDGLTIANTDIKIKKNGAASGNKNSGGATADGAGGLYHLTWDATDTGTVGEIYYSVKVAGALVVFGSYTVLEEAVYDELFGASALGYIANQPVDLNTIKTQAVTCAAGVTVLASVGAAAAPGSANGMLIGGSNAATTFAGLTTGALACTTITASGAVAFQSTFAVTTSTALAALSCSTLTASGAVAFQSTFAVTTSTSLAALSATTVTASGAVAFQSTFIVTGATTLTGGLTAAITGNITGNLSGSVGSVSGAVGSVTGAVGSVTGNVGGNVVGSVASVAGAVGSVTGNVGGNVTGSVGSVVGAVGSVTGNVGGNVVGSVASVSATVAANLTQVNGSTSGVAEFARNIKCIAIGTVASGGTDTTIPTSSFSFTVVDTAQLNGKVVVFPNDTTTGGMKSQGSPITASTTGATPTLTVTQMSRAPAAGDVFVIM